MKSYEQAALDILRGKYEEQPEELEQLQETSQIEEVSKSEVDHHFDQWMSSEHAPYHDDAGDDPKIHQAAMSYLKSSSVPKKDHKKLAMHIADKFHGSGIDEAVSHPMAVHVKSVPGKKVGGLPAYQVHKVGPQVRGIKVGEHLNDTHLDDLSDGGHKIKMKEDLDYTVISHNSFKITLPESFSYTDYLNAAKMLDENEAVKIADEFFSEQDDSLIIGSYAVSNIQEEIQSFVSEGHEVSLPKYTGETDYPGVEFTVIDKDSGVVTKFIHHGTVRRS